MITLTNECFSTAISRRIHTHRVTGIDALIVTRRRRSSQQTTNEGKNGQLDWPVFLCPIEEHLMVNHVMFFTK